MSEGWIKTYRKLQECWLWKINEPFDKRSAWVDLLLSANHADKKIFFNGKLITIERGQVLTSIRKLSEKWMWSYDKTLRYLKLLESDGMLKKESDKSRTLVTIVNYEVYQDVPITIRTPISEQSEHQQVNNPNTIRTPISEPTSDKQECKEYKNEKNVKNNYTVSKDTVRQTETVRRVIDEWNTLSKCGIAQVERLKSGSNRYAMLVARIKEYGIDAVLKAIDNIRHSKFLQGKSDSKRCWVITFDWFVRPNCFPKVLEGQYNDDNASGSSQQSITDKQLEALAEKQKADMQGEMLSDEEINRMCEEEG